jgi:hypothetical protein
MKGRGSHWKDPEKAAQTSQAMRDSWSHRRYFLVTHSDGREVIASSLEEVSKIVHRSAVTLKVYLARGEGKVSLPHDDDIITVRRVYR